MHQNDEIIHGRAAGRIETEKEKSFPSCPWKELGGIHLDKNAFGKTMQCEKRSYT